MKRTCLGLLLSFVIISSTYADDQNWPLWRGPNNIGSTDQGTYPVEFSDTKNVAWKVPLPGLGCSTPIVWGDQIILTCGADGMNTVLCISWEGEQLWQTEVGKERRGKHRNGSGSNPSATTDGQYIFAYFKSGDLGALDMDGKLLWQVNLQERYGRDTLYWDIGTSPVITKRDVVVAVMHGGESFLVAFEKGTGDVSWKTARNYKTPRECDHSYATPIVMERDGNEIILTWGAEHVTAHNAGDGSLIWECGGFNPERKGLWPAVASAVVAGDMVVVPYGRGTRLTGVRIGGKGDVTETNRAWVRDDTGSFVSTPSVVGDKVYVLKDEDFRNPGKVECIEAKSGKTIWQGQFPRGRGKFYSSPTIADGKMYAAKDNGMLYVADITDGFKLLAENDMGERIIASPVALRDRLLIRGEEHLFAIGK